MSEASKLFKDVFFKAGFIDEFSDALAHVMPAFDKRSFAHKVFDKEWKNKELKQRVRHIATVLHTVLPKHFPDAASTIVALVEHLQQKVKSVSFGYMCLPEYIEVYGIDYYKESVAAMEEVTKFMSCEFAVRPFIVKYGDKMMTKMMAWAKHKHPRVRRLATEGCRPRLPWAMALPAFKKDPSAILTILEQLKADKDIWVKKSVANNLNDMSKDNPEFTLSVIKTWKGDDPNTNWIIKHASRTLLKQGHTELMELFGFKKDKALKLERFTIHTPKVKMGKELVFSFDISNGSKQQKMVRLEYGMYYNRANGSMSKKVFKISEREYMAGETYSVTRKQSFKPITTRAYYPGLHKVSVIVNGHEMMDAEFSLTN
ncbi:DNA alkylation repair protein [Polluticoccus soli]|uniref:DNA alkylation repair protein n=1 Tax=Polluticoccus soli TaxID=3034150 RepID=UPI0023E2E7D1|nr:DNA alkylation repair protein [Flavipsychrobacter sp. JY13-12]